MTAEQKNNDYIIRRIATILEKNPNAQYMLAFKGRSMPATFDGCYEEKDVDGDEYMSLNFWDGDTGNLFDVCYRLVPEKIFMNGTAIDFNTRAE